MTDNSIQYVYRVEFNSTADRDAVFDCMKELADEEEFHYNDFAKDGPLCIYVTGDYGCDPYDSGMHVFTACTSAKVAVPPTAFTYSHSCGKMRVDEFWGGAVFITKDGVETMNTLQKVIEWRRQAAIDGYRSLLAKGG
jgi:hypothetical protein